MQVKAGDKTIDGTCVMTFKPDHKAAKHMRGEHRSMKGEHRPMRGDINGMQMKRGEPLTNAQRAELTKKINANVKKAQLLKTSKVNRKRFKSKPPKPSGKCNRFSA